MPIQLIDATKFSREDLAIVRGPEPAEKEGFCGINQCERPKFFEGDSVILLRYGGGQNDWRTCHSCCYDAMAATRHELQQLGAAEIQLRFAAALNGDGQQEIFSPVLAAGPPPARPMSYRKAARPRRGAGYELLWGDEVVGTTGAEIEARAVVDFLNTHPDWRPLT